MVWSLLAGGVQAEAESSLQGLGVEGTDMDFVGRTKMALQTKMAFQPLLTVVQGQVLNVFKFL